MPHKPTNSKGSKTRERCTKIKTISINNNQQPEYNDKADSAHNSNKHYQTLGKYLIHIHISNSTKDMLELYKENTNPNVRNRNSNEEETKLLAEGLTTLFPNLIYRLTQNPVKASPRSLQNLVRMILKFCRKINGQNNQRILRAHRRFLSQQILNYSMK